LVMFEKVKGKVIMKETYMEKVWVFVEGNPTRLKKV